MFITFFLVEILKIYVSKQTETNGWGKSTVKALSQFILNKEPGIRGYSSQNIWRMKHIEINQNSQHC